MNKTINRVLIQESRFKGEVRQFEIYNEKFVKITIQNVFGDKMYHVNMGILEPWPTMHRYLSWRWVLAMGYFGLATLIFSIYLFQHPESSTISRLIPFIMLFVLLALGALLMFMYESPNVMEFRSRYGNCPLISLLQNKPNEQEFKHFYHELKTRVLAASQTIKLDKRQMLDIELTELQRLVDKGVILEQNLEKARSRVMKMRI
jgi:hypothetical protein